LGDEGIKNEKKEDINPETPRRCPKDCMGFDLRVVKEGKRYVKE